MQEEILIKKYRSGTTIYYFNTDINSDNFPNSTLPAIVKLNSTDSVPIELHAFDGVFLTGNSSTVLWKRKDVQNSYDSEVKMNFVVDSYYPNSNYVSGRTFFETIERPITEINLENVRQKFFEKMNVQFSAGTTSFVFAEGKLIDDLYVNLKLEKSFDFLNTLNIYNKVTGEYPKRESNSGVVFGKLEAIQKISDSEGNRIRIPLRNVPVGIFEQSDQFQSPIELDDDGNRIRLNYRPLDSNERNYPTVYEDNYFNQESSVFDNTFLKQVPMDGINIHPTFKNVVYTNENGEFILHNINTGPQTLFFEVDLLKQGLTKDEVALNFFPYPPSFENTSIDLIPHYFYRAIPIDVVPSWGVSYQTGYTEVNISANLDLRKWATYIFPPVTYSGLTIDDYSFQSTYRVPLTIQVRDMSKFDESKLQTVNPSDKLEAYPSKGIQMVEIHNILEKNDNQQWEWFNEFSQIKDKAVFYTHGYHAIKLPANIYDDEEYKTDVYGNAQSGNSFNKGVWLCGYQLKMFLTKESSLYRTTGMALALRNDNSQISKWYDRDHFHCSLYKKISTLNSEESQFNSYQARGSGIHLQKFPYERAWDKNYPEKYSIPKKPTIKNMTDAEYFSELRPFIETPQYKDGDLIKGNSQSYLAGGFGLSWHNETPQYTNFATYITISEMYRYEPTGESDFGKSQYFGCYANGYSESINTVGYSSSVINAEKFQRLEAGYGYFLFPSSLPRVVPISDSGENLFTLSPNQVDLIVYPNIDDLGYHSVVQQSNSEFNLVAKTNHYNSYSMLNNSKDYAIDLSKKTNNSNALINDKLNIYRIVDGTMKVPPDEAQQTVPTYVKFIIEEMYFTGHDNFLDSNTSPTVKYDNYYKINQNDNPGTMSGVEGKVYLKITNKGDVDLKLKYITFDEIETEIVIEVNQGIVFCNTIETGKIQINTFKNFTIIAQGNSSYNNLNNRFDKCILEFNLNADWTGFKHGQQVENMHIRKDCSSSICTFNAFETYESEENIWYADSVWRSVDIKFKKINENGYPSSDTNKGYDKQVANIHGLYFNPGYFSKMTETANGFTESKSKLEGNNSDEYQCRRLRGTDNGYSLFGSSAFYWSSLQNKSRSTQYAIPYMSIKDITSFNNWESRGACSFKMTEN